MIPSEILPGIRGVYASVCRSSRENTRRAPHSALLKTGRRIPGHRFVIRGFDPFLLVRAKGREISIFGNRVFKTAGDPFEALGYIMDFYGGVKCPPRLPVPPGAIGAFSYDLKDVIETLPSSCEDALHCPDIHFAFFRNFIVTNLLTGESYSLKLDVAGGGGASQAPVAAAEGPGAVPRELRSDFSREEYISAVLEVKDRIIRGDIYQANISQQFSMKFGGDSFALFEAIDRINPAPMSAYLDCGDFRLISSSPERFLRRKGNLVETRPIKGTRPRGACAREDRLLKNELLGSEKDSAELAMIIDLLRNDLSRSALPGTVRVARPKIIEKYSNVFHSLAVVNCRVGGDFRSLELIKNCFPGGSVTGCPKIQSMKVIEEIEKHKRSFYCGSIGYIGYNGDFDLNIAIRTFIEKNGSLFFNLGGGIVFDSDPQAEYEETIHKGRSMFNVVKTSALGTF